MTDDASDDQFKETGDPDYQNSQSEEEYQEYNNDNIWDDSSEISSTVHNKHSYSYPHYSSHTASFREKFNQSPLILNFSKEKIPIPKCIITDSLPQSENPNEIEPQFNILGVHQRYETIEMKIGDSSNSNMIHSGQIIVFDRLDQTPLTLNEKECLKRERYKNIQTMKRIPKSWDAYKWDQDNERMRNDENEKFEFRLNEIDFLAPDGEIREWQLPYDSDDNSMITRRKQALPFTTSLLDYSTDAFEDQTDIEFCD